MGATGALTACSVFREGNGKVPRHERTRAGDKREQGKRRRGAERKATPAADGARSGGAPGIGSATRQEAWAWTSLVVVPVRRLVCMVWFRRCPWASQVCPFSSTYDTSRFVASSR